MAHFGIGTPDLQVERLIQWCAGTAAIFVVVVGHVVWPARRGLVFFVGLACTKVRTGMGPNKKHTERTVVACVRQLFLEKSLSTTKIKREI